MFDDLIKTLKGLNKKSISVEIAVDEHGFIDRQCPADNCEFNFKVDEKDWLGIVSDEAVWCPMCRHEAPADQWFTKEQVEHAQSEALKVVEGEIDRSLRSDAKRFNRQQRRSAFVSISIEVPGGTHRAYTLPSKAAELMELKIQCEECGSRFAVIGSAYFCPACGANSVIRTFADSLRKIRAKIESENTIRNVLEEMHGKDAAELTCRSLRESCLLDGVTAFQKYNEGLYESYGQGPPNAFQRIDGGSKLWRDAVGHGYDSWLNESEMGRLLVLFQKRHLLAHTEGIVDERYILKSGDNKYNLGQRIVISRSDIESLLNLLEKLSDDLRSACQDG